MRKIRIYQWNEKSPQSGKEEDVDTRILITNMVKGIPPQNIPRGLDNFRIMLSLHESLEKSKGKEYLNLEENVYKFLEDNCLTNIPAVWGMMDDISLAILAIVDAEQIDVNE